MKRTILGIVLLGYLGAVVAQGVQSLSFGTEETLDVMTWNIERFPKNGEVTVDFVINIIQALDVDLIALQEINDASAFLEVDMALEDWQGYYSNSGLAYLFKPDEIEIIDVFEIFPDNNREFPREPLVMEFIYRGEFYVAINNHFKCCGDGLLDGDDAWDEERRREDASELLDLYVDFSFPDDRVIIMGDLNDELTDSPSHNVFEVFLDDPDSYRFADMEIAEGNFADWSFPNWPSHLDHILISNELFEAFGESATHVEAVRVDDVLPGGFDAYDDDISDHRPVAMRIDVSDGTTSTRDQSHRPAKLLAVPNPASGAVTIHIDASAENSELHIVDMLGQIVQLVTLLPGQAELACPLLDMPSGIYGLQQVSRGRIVGYGKLVVAGN